MDLWIRSQDKRNLVKVNALWVMGSQIWMEVPFYENCKKLGLMVTGHNQRIATYKSQKRALEVLDEIQKKIKNQFLLEPEAMMKFQDLEFIKKYFDDINKIDTVVCNAKFKMTPINSNVVIYQMPQE